MAEVITCPECGRTVKLNAKATTSGWRVEVHAPADPVHGRCKDGMCMGSDDHLFPCEECHRPMVRDASKDEPIHWGSAPHGGDECKDDEGLYEAYVCPNGHVYFEPLD
jgi:endogenous inhibitor of DNA gyrase (YacG/DUF329 family)